MSLISVNTVYRRFSVPDSNSMAARFLKFVNLKAPPLFHRKQRRHSELDCQPIGVFKLSCNLY